TAAEAAGNSTPEETPARSGAHPPDPPGPPDRPVLSRSTDQSQAASGRRSACSFRHTQDPLENDTSRLRRPRSPRRLYRRPAASGPDCPPWCLLPHHRKTVCQARRDVSARSGEVMEFSTRYPSVSVRLLTLTE